MLLLTEAGEGRGRDCDMNRSRIPPLQGWREFFGVYSQGGVGLAQGWLIRPLSGFGKGTTKERNGPPLAEGNRARGGRTKDEDERGYLIEAAMALAASSRGWGWVAPAGSEVRTMQVV